MTTWRSTPGSAQSSSPAKSVIVAHAGTRTLPRRRRQPRTSSPPARSRRSRPPDERRDEAKEPAEAASERPHGRGEGGARLRRSAAKRPPNSQGAARNCQRYASRSSQRTGRRSDGSASQTTTSDPSWGVCVMSSARARAAAMCPSPIGAVSTRTRIGRPPSGTNRQDRRLAGTARRFSRLARWRLEPARELRARQRGRARPRLRRQPLGDHDRDPAARRAAGSRHRLDLRPRAGRARSASCSSRCSRAWAQCSRRARAARTRPCRWLELALGVVLIGFGVRRLLGRARRGGADRDAALAAGDREHLRTRRRSCSASTRRPIRS